MSKVSLTALALVVLGISSSAYATPNKLPTDQNPKRFDKARFEAAQIEKDTEGTRAQLDAAALAKSNEAAKALPTDPNPKRFDALKADAAQHSGLSSDNSPRAALGSVDSAANSKKAPTDANPKRYDAMKAAVN